MNEEKITNTKPIAIIIIVTLLLASLIAIIFFATKEKEAPNLAVITRASELSEGLNYYPTSVTYEPRVANGIPKDVNYYVAIFTCNIDGQERKIEVCSQNILTLPSDTLFNDKLSPLVTGKASEECYFILSEEVIGRIRCSEKLNNIIKAKKQIE